MIGAGALRGLKDTRWPMAFAAVAYWGVGMSLAVGLGFGLGWGGLGIWIGSPSRSRSPRSSWSPGSSPCNGGCCRAPRPLRTAEAMI